MLPFPCPPPKMLPATASFLPSLLLYAPTTNFLISNPKTLNVFPQFLFTPSTKKCSSQTSITDKDVDAGAGVDVDVGVDKASQTNTMLKGHEKIAGGVVSTREVSPT